MALANCEMDMMSGVYAGVLLVTSGRLYHSSQFMKNCVDVTVLLTAFGMTIVNSSLLSNLSPWFLVH